VFIPPPPTNPVAEKRGKWVDANGSKPENKIEEKKPEPAANNQKKGKWA